MPKDGKYYQGKFHPKNPQKYIGNVNNIVYRSFWELKFMRKCDRSENVLEWGSEEFFIPYYDPSSKKTRKYFPDFIVKMKEGDGKVKKYVIEIKPKHQTVPPVQTSKKKTKTYINEVYTYVTNDAKWKAAIEFCKDNLMEFKILTEQELGIK